MKKGKLGKQPFALAFGTRVQDLTPCSVEIELTPGGELQITRIQASGRFVMATIDPRVYKFKLEGFNGLYQAHPDTLLMQRNEPTPPGEVHSL